LRRGEIWWADRDPYRPQEQTGRRPVVIGQSETLIGDHASLAGTALLSASEQGLPAASVALAFQMRAIPKSALNRKVRDLSEGEIAESELATDEALGRVEPERPDR